MYTIIANDGRQYGPVAINQLRQWIAEGRVNAQTLAQAEGSAEWKALSAYPDVATLFGPPRIPSGGSLQKPPGADKKITAGICGILLGGLGIHKFVLGYTGEGVTMLLISLLTCGFGYVVMYIIGLIEGIIYLTKSDEEFVATYVTGRKGWF